MTTDLKQDSNEQFKTLGYQFSAAMKFIVSNSTVAIKKMELTNLPRKIN